MENMISTEEIFTQSQMPKAGLDFLHFGEEESLFLDNREVEQDELLMRLGHFWGFDNVTGQQTFFEIHSNNLRESVHSVNSRCSNRIRQLIVALSLHHGMPPTSTLENILASYYRGKKVLLLEHNSAFASVFMYYCRKLEIDLVTTEYFGDIYESGLMVQSVLHLDIIHSHFPDSSFDLIIHTDVFEHVSDAPAGEKEVMRILKKDGCSVFTVPFDFELVDDDIYAETLGNKIIYKKEPVYHDDPVSPDGRCLVFRIFSLRGMTKRFADMGCRLRYYYFHARQLGILGNNACAFVATRK